MDYKRELKMTKRDIKAPGANEHNHGTLQKNIRQPETPGAIKQ